MNLENRRSMSGSTTKKQTSGVEKHKLRKKAMNDRQVLFVENYVQLGDAGTAAKLAGYEGKDLIGIRRTGYRLRRELQQEISAAMEGVMYDKGPKALETVELLMKTSKSDTVRLAAAKDLLDRSGFKPRERVVHENEKLSSTELQSRIVALVGKEIASQLLQKEDADLKQRARLKEAEEFSIPGTTGSVPLPSHKVN